MPTRRLLGIGVDDRYRTIPEEPIIETLILVGWAHDTGSPIARESARNALQSWMHAGLGHARAPNGEPLFDPVEVYNFMKRAGLEGRDSFWSERVVETRCRLVSTWAGDCPPGTLAVGRRRFTVNFRRTFNLSAIPAGTSLRLRAPFPATGDYLEDLEFEPLAVADPGAKIHASAGRLEVRMVASGEPSATIGATLRFTARQQEPGQNRLITDHERALCLTAREGWIFVSERIRALAATLSAEGSPSIDAVRSYWDFIHREMVSGVIHYDQVNPISPCDWTLDAGWFDCQLGSSLFVALCRARGIPARLAGGYLLYPATPSNHFWAEAWLEDRGWMAFDFIGWDIRRAGGHPELEGRFFGRLDYRMACERLPRVFMGALGMPIPPAWTLLQVPKPGGVEIGLHDIRGSPIYTDTIQLPV